MAHFDPVNFYHLAQKIYQNAEKLDSASARTCINRAYYAAFLTARAKGKIKNNGSGVHKDVINHLKKKRCILAANRMSTLFILRKEADYDLNKVITLSDSGKALKLSRAILESFGVKIQ